VFNEKFFQSPQVRTQNFSKLDFAKKKKYFFARVLSVGIFLKRTCGLSLSTPTFFKFFKSLSSPLKKIEYKENHFFF